MPHFYTEGDKLRGEGKVNFKDRIVGSRSSL